MIGDTFIYQQLHCTGAVVGAEEGWVGVHCRVGLGGEEGEGS